ncbi:MAG: tRNA guanosine(34) transglycosylase Tgt, partial [Bacteroidia bacterium]
MKFSIAKKNIETKARAAVIQTARGEIETPIFMPVGTQGTVKGVTQKDLEEEIKAQIILANTYHIYLRPGLDVISNAGGIHNFINWKKPMLTDSGGYQVFSMTDMRKISEDGVWFQSHIDGSKHFFSPENAIDIQRKIGADFIMAFDECTPFPCEYDVAKKSMEMTNRWLTRCIKQFDETEELYGFEQNLFPIVQGSIYKD